MVAKHEVTSHPVTLDFSLVTRDILLFGRLIGPNNFNLSNFKKNIENFLSETAGEGGHSLNIKSFHCLVTSDLESMKTEAIQPKTLSLSRIFPQLKN